MTREAKVGLLLGLVFIIAIAVVLRGLHPNTSENETVALGPATSEAVPNANLSVNVNELNGGETGNTTAQDASVPQNNPNTNTAPANVPSGRRGLVETLTGTPETPETRREISLPPQRQPVETVVELPSARPILPEPEPASIPAENPEAVITPDASVASEIADNQVPAEQNPPVENGIGNTQNPGVNRAANVTIAPQGLPAELKKLTMLVEPSEPVASKVMSYTVGKGESLSRVALRVYGPVEGKKPANIEAIYKANKKLLKDIDSVREGQKLNIPAIAGVKIQNLDKPAAPVVPESGNAVAPSAVVNNAKTKKVETPVLPPVALNQVAMNLKPVAAPSLTETTVNPGTSPAGSPAASDGNVYVVKKDDTLWSIARAKLGSGAKYKVLASANGLKDSDNLKEGMKIRLP